HPNVVPVFDAGTYEDQVYVAMELVEGNTLRRWLRAPRSRRDILAVFASAGRGLAAAHEADLVHRDFKPENVLVGDDGRVRVTDSGLGGPASAGDSAANVLGAEEAAPSRGRGPDDGGWRRQVTLTRAGQFVGTPAYMAPEQFRRGAADPSADQFSF